MKLEPVPKVIRPLVIHWCPRAYIVSFKLETDPSLLLSKAHQALRKYEHDAVIANLLTERKRKVTIIRSTDDAGPAEAVIEAGEDGQEIEELIVNQILVYFAAHQQAHP